jgi:hypothetical protein
MHLWPPMRLKADNADRVQEKQKSRASARLAVGLSGSRHRVRAGAAVIRRRMLQKLGFMGAFMGSKARPVNKPGRIDKQKGRPEGRPFRKPA